MKKILFLMLLVIGSVASAGEKDSACLRELFPLRLNALANYKWGGDDSSLVGLRDDGKQEIINSAGSFLIDGFNCQNSNPDRNFAAVVAIAVTNAKLTKPRETIEKMLKVCKNADSEQIRRSVTPKAAPGGAGPVDQDDK